MSVNLINLNHRLDTIVNTERVDPATKTQTIADLLFATRIQPSSPLLQKAAYIADTHFKGDPCYPKVLFAYSKQLIEKNDYKRALGLLMLTLKQPEHHGSLSIDIFYQIALCNERLNDVKIGLKAVHTAIKCAASYQSHDLDEKIYDVFYDLFENVRSPLPYKQLLEDFLSHLPDDCVLEKSEIASRLALVHAENKDYQTARDVIQKTLDVVAVHADRDDISDMCRLLHTKAKMYEEEDLFGYKDEITRLYTAINRHLSRIGLGFDQKDIEDYHEDDVKLPLACRKSYQSFKKLVEPPKQTYKKPTIAHF